MGELLKNVGSGMIHKLFEVEELVPPKWREVLIVEIKRIVIIGA